MKSEFTTLEVARRLGCTRAYLIELIALGRIPGARKTDDGQWRIPAAFLDAWAARLRAQLDRLAGGQP